SRRPSDHKRRFPPAWRAMVRCPLSPSCGRSSGPSGNSPVPPSGGRLPGLCRGLVRTPPGLSALFFLLDVIIQLIGQLLGDCQKLRAVCGLGSPGDLVEFLQGLLGGVLIVIVLLLGFFQQLGPQVLQVFIPCPGGEVGLIYTSYQLAVLIVDVVAGLVSLPLKFRARVG